MRNRREFAGLKKKHKKIHASAVVIHVCILLLLAGTIMPLYMTLINSVKGELQFQEHPFIITFPIDLINYPAAFAITYRYILNTIFVAICGITGCLFISSLSAYVFARMDFFGKEFLFTLIIVLMMIPGTLSMIPNYLMYTKFFGLYNNVFGIILPFIAGGPIFGTFLLRSSFEGIPKDIFESARCEGAGELRVYMSICLPLSLPIMGTYAIMNIVSIWNDVVWPNLLIEDTAKLTVAAGLYRTFQEWGSTNYPYQFAAYLITSLPITVLFFFATRVFVEGLTTSGLKM